MKKLGVLLGLFILGCGLTAATLEQVNTTSPQTLSSKILASPAISGTVTGTYTLGGTPTITSPSISNPVLSGTVTGTYTLAGTPTITSPAISNPTLSGTAIGTYTLGGTSTINTAQVAGHQIGPTTPDSATQLWMTGTVAGSGWAYGLRLTPTLSTAAAGDGYAIAANPSFTRPGSGAATNYATMLLVPPSVSGAGGTVTSVTALKILGAATGGATNNRQIWTTGSTGFNHIEGSLQVDTGLALPGASDITAIDEIQLTDAAANATASGRLRRNATALTWHDGTTPQVLLTQNQAVKNPIINGNLEVWQRGTTFPAIANNAYGPDRFAVFYSTAGVVTINRSTNVPTVAQAGVLFNYSLEVDVTTADAAVAAGDHFEIEHRLEGYNWRHFAQRDFTVSFWVMSSKTGAHGFSVTNGAFLREYLTTFTINSADTWEYKTITVPASPSAGTWDYVNGVGLRMYWSLMAGSTWQGTATGAWQTLGSNVTGTAAQPNVLDSTSNFFRITGVKMELGSVATPIQFVPFEEELARCQRYYQKSFLYATAPAQNVGNAGAFFWTSPYTATTAYTILLPLRPILRASAGTTVFYNTNAANALARNSTDTADDTTTSAITTDGSIAITITPNATNTVGDLHQVHWTVDSEL